jgi:molybdopterin-containing oxidoreductase family iron-sulfur binding subunit
MCTERIAVDKVPYCVEACHAEGNGALVFGDLADPESEIRKLAESRLSIRRRVDTGNRPQVFYTL